MGDCSGLDGCLAAGGPRCAGRAILASSLPLIGPLRMDHLLGAPGHPAGPGPEPIPGGRAFGIKPWWPHLGLVLVIAGLTACVPAQQRPSWRIYPLQRSQPHDGLAVVNQPDGYGLHLWLETDTSDSGVCRPRWVIDGARLFNGNGSAPFSSGLATRQEFFSAVARRDVVRALRQELEALCQARAPRSRWQWLEPPLHPAAVQRGALPARDSALLQSLEDPEARAAAARELESHRAAPAAQ